MCAHLPICSQCFATALQYVDLPLPAGPITICPCLPIATRVRYERRMRMRMRMRVRAAVWMRGAVRRVRARQVDAEGATYVCRCDEYSMHTCERMSE